MKSAYSLSSYLFVFFLIALPSCSDQQNDTFSFTGEWTIETYMIYSEVDGEVISNQMYEDAGYFRFMNGGSGLVTINIPGISLPDNNPISWNFNQTIEEMTIDYQTGQDPFTFNVIIQSDDLVTLENKMIRESSESTSLLQTTIELSKNN